MGSILPFIQKGSYAFDDEITRPMGEAFEAACGRLNDTGQPVVVREVIAMRIIAAARRGERDPSRLRNMALAALGFDADA
jgi:hypothetical protein